MSSIAKANISLSKKDLTKSRILPVASRNVVFYHKATSGQATIDLLALIMPSEMPSQVQATVEEINGSLLYNNKKNLTLKSSSKGDLIQGLDYLVTSAYTISLIGPGFTAGAEVDEIFEGKINAAPVSDLVVASARSVDKTYTLAVGSTILNLGREYKTGVNSLDDIGSIKVFVNGVLAHRNAEYYEIDSGNGYGTTIGFYAAPVSLPYTIAVDFGVMSITDSDGLGSIESLSGAVKKLADDLAVVAGTDADDYFAANPSEIERRTFGDNVLALLQRATAIEAYLAADPYTMIFRSNVAQSIANNSAIYLNFEVSEFNNFPAGAVISINGGFGFQVPAGMGGIYDIGGGFGLSTGAGAALQQQIYIIKNNAVVLRQQCVNATTAGAAANPIIGTTIVAKLVPGDYVQINAYQQSGAARNTTSGATSDNYISIVKRK